MACFDTKEVKVSCGSHCWPNCEPSPAGVHPTTMNFNHYLVIPANTQCFIDTLDYGRFDAYLSKYSKVSVLYDTYIMQNGVCVRSYQGIKMLPGSLHGDPYC